MLWFCEKCNVKALDVMKLVSTLQEKHNALDEKLNEVEKKVNGIVQVTDEDFKGNLSTLVQQEMYEAKDREKRINNLFINGITEYEDDNEDEGKVNHVFKDLLGLDEINVVAVKRIGVADLEKTRPLLVELENRNVRDKVLRKSNILKDIGEGKDIYISPDQTKKQQAEN